MGKSEQILPQRKISFHSLIRRNRRALGTATVAFTKLGVLSSPVTLRGPVFRLESRQAPRRVTFSELAAHWSLRFIGICSVQLSVPVEN